MRKILLLFMLSVSLGAAMAQTVYNSSGKAGFHKKEKKGYDPSKLVLGGGINLGYNSGAFVAGASPIVGYRFLKPLAVGIGVGYLYYQEPIQLATKQYIRQHMIYPGLWARCTIYHSLYGIASFEHYIISQSYPNYDATGKIVRTKFNFDANCLFAGLGLRQPLGGRASFIMEVMHDFLQEKNSPYAQSPIVLRAGIAVGL